MIKGLLTEEKLDVLLANDIPEYEALYSRLVSSGVFGNVIEYDAKNIRDRRKGKKDLLYYLTDKRIIKKKIETYCKCDFSKYQDIYVYHDISEIGKYFLMNKIKYHLLEDALDYFKYFDKYYDVKEGSYKDGTFKFFLKKYFNIGYKAWGSSDECIDIEVNDLKGIKITKEKCFEVPRKDLFEKLSVKDRILIFDTFAAGKELSGTNGKNAIICTQPLYQDSFVSTENDQLQVFRSVIREYYDKKYKIIIKPHPRDEADYSEILDEFNADLIDKNLPSEILNFKPDAKYDVAVSITSTAINFLQYAEEKRFMGREYITEVLSGCQ